MPTRPQFGIAFIIAACILTSCQQSESHSTTSAGNVPPHTNMVLTVSGTGGTGEFTNQGPGTLTIQVGNEPQMDLHAGASITIHLSGSQEIVARNLSDRNAGYMFWSGSAVVSTSVRLRGNR